jgi:hypothetical protein
MLSRRQLAGAAAAAMLVPGGAASAQGTLPPASALSFVPGGRIGFKRPAGLRPHANRWHLLVPDQTFEVVVSERLRLGADWDAVIWEQDGRHALIASDRIAGEIERRRFRDQRFGDSVDFSAEVHAFRDAGWLGQIRLSTRLLSALRPPRTPGDAGQVERWRGIMEELAGSITIRPALAVPDALAELRVGLATDGLHPRLNGPHLFLSLAPPTAPLELIGFKIPHIAITDLAVLPLGDPNDMAQAYEELFRKLRDRPGNRVVVGASCRAVIHAETPSAASNSATFISYADAFGRARHLRLTAAYDAARRTPILQALERVLASLSLPDAA